MRLKSSLFIAAVATSISSTAPLYAQQVSTAYNPTSVYSVYTDQSLLDVLVYLYQRDPSTYESSIEYISLNRPSIKSAFLSRTLSKGQSSATEYNHTGGSYLSTTGIVAAGAAVGVFAAVLSKSSGSDSSDSTPSPAPTPPPIAEDPVEGDAASFRTTEYNNNYALRAINAADRYAAGAQGQGVRVAILDSGIDIDHSEFAGRINSEHSYSYIGDTGAYTDTGTHGTHVAGIVAAAKDDNLTHGVAFGSELVIFKGIPGSPDETPNRGGVWGDAINRAINADVAVMNNSWSYGIAQEDGTSRTAFITDFASRQDLNSFLGTTNINGLQNAARNDLLSVVAAANDGADQVSVGAGVPHLMPELEGYFIATVATDQSGNIAPYSNRCGIAMDWCIAAPGTDIISSANGGGAARLSGTSMAAPHVAGAAAVLKSQSPELTAPQISQILFDTATDLGDLGVDEVYGHGLLNLQNATAPQGNLVIYEQGSTLGKKTNLADTSIIASSAMGSALTSALSKQSIMVGDKYDRGFYMDADSIVGTVDAPTPTATSLRTNKINDDITIISSSTGYGAKLTRQNETLALARGNMPTAQSDEAMNPLSLISSDFSAAYTTDIASGLSLTTSMAAAAGDEAHMASTVGISAKFAAADVYASVGAIKESGTVMGTKFSGAAGSNGQSDTRYMEIGSILPLSELTSVSFTGIVSDTAFTQDGLITSGNGLSGSSAKLSVSRKGVMNMPGVLTASVSTPLQVTSGTLSVNLPQSRGASEDGVVSTSVDRAQNDIEIGSVRRPIDINLSYASEPSKYGAQVMLNAGYRKLDNNSSPFMGFSVTKRF